MIDYEKERRKTRVLTFTLVLIAAVVALCVFSGLAIDFTEPPKPGLRGSGIIPALFVALTGIGNPAYGVIGSHAAAWMARLSLLVIVLSFVALARSGGLSVGKNKNLNADDA